MKNGNVNHLTNNHGPKANGGGNWQKWTSLACIIVAAIFMAGSGYSLGKNENDKNSDLYKAAIAFLVIGILMVLGFGVWLVMTKCQNVHASFSLH